MAESTHSRRLRALTTSSLLCVLSVILYFLTQIPVLNFVGMIACPIPIIQIAVEYGWKFSALSSVVATVLVTMTLGPVQGYFYLSLFAVMGVVIGALAIRKYNAAEMIVYGTLAVLIFNLFFYYGIEKVLGLEDFLKQGAVMAEKVITEIFDNFKGIVEKDPSSDSLKSLRLLFETAIKAIFTFPLALFTVLSFSLFYVYYLISQFWFNKIKKPFRQMPAPFFWKPTPAIAWIMIGISLTHFLCGFSSSELLKKISFNLFSTFYFFLFFLTLSLANYFLIAMRAGFLIRLTFITIYIPLVIMSWVMPFPIHLLPIIPALLDAFKNFRNLLDLKDIPCEISEPV